ncbi:hypothetical protein FHS43_002559 [Streptosporangium becharense]|uniref:Uncharacterized protein n=1 Tax=Streptosporangium becharense TaxID=1816182 RepID=A0A7W9IK96_9ACTN|nr:hypothetical protein [Streptosporangium becharense]MBB2911294.1 hypothetical protein [Streptosporangium becharense]MBB5821648.1 hypothetical protein [Streptosporangium becharense]
MSATPRTELGDIAPVGMELDESALGAISGGAGPVIVTGEYFDPPGWCQDDKPPSKVPW